MRKATARRKRHWLEDRLDELPGKNQAGLARALGTTESRISELKSGNWKIPTNKARIAAKYLELEVNSILSLIEGVDTEEPLQAVYVVGEVRAGAFHEAIEWDHSQWSSAPVTYDPRYPRCRQFGLRVSGPSMNQEYPEGSTVVCVSLLELPEDLKHEDHVIVHRRGPDGLVEATVKELRKDSAGRFWLWPRSYHPEHQQPWPAPDPVDGGDNDDLRITAKVIGSYKTRP